MSETGQHLDESVKHPLTSLGKSAHGAEVGDAQPAEAVANPFLLLEIQRDLAIGLLQCNDLQQCLDLLLGCAMRLPGFDCGGIYRCDEATGSFHLVAHYGLSDAFVEQSADMPADSPQVQVLQAGALLYALCAELPPAVVKGLVTEGLEVLVVVPLRDKDRVIAALNVSSHRHSRIDREARVALESLVAQVEGALALIREREVRQHAERQLLLAVEGAQLGTWIGNLNSGVFRASARTRAMHKITTEGPFTVESVMESIHPDDRAQVAAALQRTATSGEPLFCEYRLAAEGGGGRWLVSEARIFDDERGHHLYGIVRDVSERKREQIAMQKAHDLLEQRVAERTAELEAANAELREKSLRLEIALDASQAGTWVLDVTSEKMAWGRRSRTLYGFADEGEVSLGDYLARIHPEDRDRLSADLREATLPGTGDAWNHEFRITHPVHGGRWIAGFGRVERDASGLALRLTCIDFDISVRKQAEQARQRSEVLLNATQHLSKVGGWLWDVEAQSMFWTEETYRIHGYPPGVPGTDLQEHIAKSLGLCDEAYRLRILAAFQRCAEHGEPYDIEYPFTTATGRRLWVRTTARAVQDGARIVKVIGNIMDITERRQAEAALRESHELLTRFIQVSPIYSYIKTVTPTESRVLHASENFQQMIGVAGSAMVGKTMTDLFSADIAAKITADDLAVVTCGEMITVDEDLNGRNYTSLKFPISQGTKTLLGGYTIDVTERTQAERTLHEWNATLEQRVAVRTLKLNQSEARFRQLAEATFEGVAISEAGILLDGNSRLAKLHGYKLAEILGRPVSDLIAPESRELVAERLRVNNEQPYEFIALRKDGSTFPAEVRGRTGFWMGREMRVSALRDLTTTKQTTAKLHAQQAALEHVQQFALIAEVSAGIVHQLGQPLSAIGANLSAMVKCDAGELQRSGTLAIIKDVEADVARMRDIVIHLRALADPLRPTRAALDFNGIVADAVSVLQPKAASRQIRIALELGPDLPSVSADAVQMNQVIRNLVRNAFDASDGCPPERRVVLIATRVITDEAIEFSVRDAGTGIAPEAMTCLFSPFFSTKPDGMGIGLRLSQTIVRAHDGSIEGYNNPDGVGATFRVVLPACAPS
jgi:PAS domain S-box-containing protein